jgi:DNA-directed RNA polymerase subunit delta
MVNNSMMITSQGRRKLIVAKRESDVDLAYQILKQQGQEMHFRNLIGEVLEIRGRRISSLAQAMAEVHTLINMDSRFAYHGNGTWGLLEWSNKSNRTISEENIVVEQKSTRRTRLLEEIQQDYDYTGMELD